jgi:hypothetical protein
MKPGYLDQERMKAFQAAGIPFSDLLLRIVKVQ